MAREAPVFNPEGFPDQFVIKVAKPLTKSQGKMGKVHFNGGCGTATARYTVGEFKIIGVTDDEIEKWDLEICQPCSRKRRNETLDQALHDAFCDVFDNEGCSSPKDIQRLILALDRRGWHLVRKQQGET